MKNTLFVLGIAITISVQAQLSGTYNSIRPGDEIIKQQVEYKDPGREGENVVWDFSSLKPLNPEYELSYTQPVLVYDSLYIMGRDTFSCKNTNIEELVIGTEHQTMYYYRLVNDTLYCLGHENARVLFHYQKPVIHTVYSLDFAETAQMEYSGKGLYSSAIPFEISGEIKTRVDAKGKIILPSKDTLDHITRVKTTQIIHEMEKDTAKNRDMPAGHKEIITYRWYSKGYRYPVFEVVESGYPADTTGHEKFATAFFYPPQEHYYLEEDEENRIVLSSLINRNGHPQQAGKASIEDILYNFFPNPILTTFHIEYILLKDAHLSLTIYDLKGKEVKAFPESFVKKGSYTETMDCSGLRRDQYILQIKLDDEVINEKIFKY